MAVSAIPAEGKLDSLLRLPYEFLECSWPRPVTLVDGHWASPPEWDAPLMPYRPQPRWELLDHMPIWTIDWRGFFRSMIQDCGKLELSGQMRRFQIVFRIRALASGRLAVWSDDGCIIRRREQLLLEDRAAHTATRHVVDIQLGDVLDIALWQLGDAWSWGAGFLPPSVSAEDAAVILNPFLHAARGRLAAPTGPPIKLMADGRNPYRTVVTLYSMILNGYVPTEVLLYGDHQWSAEARTCFEAYLPFASIIPTTEVCTRLEALAGTQLSLAALRYWFVMKAGVALLEAPNEFCSIDDDVFVLDGVDDALSAFRDCDFVFVQDFDFGDDYARAWSGHFQRKAPLSTGAGNVGLTWQRQRHDRTTIAQAMLESTRSNFGTEEPRPNMPIWVWEQGLINVLYADGPVWSLPSERYPVLKLDGLPGGMLGYDYARNPCGFAAVHFAGGWPARPTDLVTLALVPAILGKRPVPADSVLPFAAGIDISVHAP